MRSRSVPTIRKNEATSSAKFEFSALRSPRVLANSTEVSTSRKPSISIDYKNRTKWIKSGGLERNGRRERIWRAEQLAKVRRFARECPQTLRISARPKRAREHCQKPAGGRDGIRIPGTESIADVCNFNSLAVDNLSVPENVGVARLRRCNSTQN
jgi:hypothetical protein